VGRSYNKDKVTGMLDVTRTLADFKEFLSSEDMKGVVDKDDIDRLQEVARGMVLSRDILDSRMDVHMHLELELAWLTSKYQEIMEDYERQVEKIKGNIRSTLYQDTNWPEHQLKSIVRCDPAFIEADDRLSKVKKLHGFIERLHISLRRRETLIDSMCRRDARSHN